MAPVRPKSKHIGGPRPPPATSGRGGIPSSKPTATPILESPFDDSDPFRTNKRDKRSIKHSTFLSKIEKSNKKTLKRRRPSKKLVANLDSLADALPDAGDDVEHPSANQVNIIQHKSLKHRPGALKRKEKLDRMERDRFAKNMAQMAGGSTGAELSNAPAKSAPNPTANRWAALRGFISQTLDQKPEFKTGK